MATSYICEHSAEFSIVPYLKSFLEKEFRYVVPISPWLSREFARKSKEVHKNAEFQVLAVFPRRPKTNEEKDIFVTLNSEIYTFRDISAKYGIEVIAGCPLATDFWELATTTRYVWFDVGHASNCEYLIKVTSPTAKGDGFLSDEQILDLVRKSALQSIGSLEEFVREARSVQPHLFFGSRYKPVYFLVRAY